MPLLEQFYYPAPGEGGPLFANSLIDPRNNALIQLAGDVVTIRLTICAQSIIPLYDDGLPNGLGFAGARLDVKYRPCDTVRAVGYNTDKGYAIAGSPLLPVPPALLEETPAAAAVEGDLAAPMAVFITPDGQIQIGSFEFFSAFFEPCSVNLQYIACEPPPDPTNTDPPVPGTAGGQPGPFGVRKVSR